MYAKRPKFINCTKKDDLDQFFSENNDFWPKQTSRLLIPLLTSGRSYFLHRTSYWHPGGMVKKLLKQKRIVFKIEIHSSNPDTTARYVTKNKRRMKERPFSKKSFPSRDDRLEDTLYITKFAHFRLYLGISGIKVYVEWRLKYPIVFIESIKMVLKILMVSKLSIFSKVLDESQLEKFWHFNDEGSVLFTIENQISSCISAIG